MFNGKPQNLLHVFVELLGLAPGDTASGRARMDTRRKERLIGIDVPNAAQERLIEQQRFNGAFARF